MKEPGKNAYQIIGETIRQRINDGTYLLGGQLPTELELVKEFNVSRMTVSKGLEELIREKLIERIRGKGTFVCRRQLPPQTLRVSELPMVRCLWPGEIYSQSLASNSVLQGICNCLNGSELQTGITFYRNEAEFETLLQPTNNGNNCAGYVVWPSPLKGLGKALNALRQRHIPLVVLDSVPENFVGDFIGTNNALGAQQGIDYLVKQGHRKIAYLSMSPNMSSLSERFAGVIAAMTRNQLDIHADWFEIIPTDDIVLPNRAASDNRQLIQRYLGRLLQLDKDQRPTAIFCSNDSIAITVLELLQEANIRVPEEISVLGFDNIDRGAWLPVPLSSISHDFREIGRLAGQLLKAQCSGIDSYCENGKISSRYLVCPELMERGSVRKLL